MPFTEVVKYHKINVHFLKEFSKGYNKAHEH